MTTLRREITYQTVDQLFVERAFIAARAAADGGEGATVGLERLVALISDAALLADLPRPLVLAAFLRLLEPLANFLANGNDYNWHDDCCDGDCPEMDESLHPDAMLASTIEMRMHAEGELAVTEVMES